MDRNTVAEMVRRMHANGLIGRRPLPDDGRAYELHLVPAEIVMINRVTPTPLMDFLDANLVAILRPANDVPGHVEKRLVTGNDAGSRWLRVTGFQSPPLIVGAWNFSLRAEERGDVLK